MSHESVDLAYLEDDTLTSEIHSIAIETMLHLHIQATGSSKAYEIISNWDAQKRFLRSSLQRLSSSIKTQMKYWQRRRRKSL